jgi:integrase
MKRGDKPGALTEQDAISAPLANLGKTRKLNDGGGLFLLITDSAKGWRFRYKRAGKDAMLSLGVFPSVGLVEARRLAQEQRDLLARGTDPVASRSAEKVTNLLLAATFGSVARRYNDGVAARVAAGVQSVKTLERCERMYRFSAKLHGRSFDQIRRADMLELCETVAKSGRRESAHRLGIWLRAVWLYAIDKEHCKPENDPTARGFSRSLTRDGLGVETANRPALTDPAAVGALMRVIDGSEWLLEDGRGVTGPTVGRALQLLARTVVRPGELAAAEWYEFKLKGDEPEWTIPLARMKMKDGNRTDHVVPLSRQAVALLEAQKELTGELQYVFPHHRSNDRPMTGAAMPAAMLALGYRDQHCPHGFRSTFSTLSRDVLKAESEIIERQLAHRVGSEVQGAYDRSQRLGERRVLMQQYSDLLDRLRDG